MSTRTRSCSRRSRPRRFSCGTGPAPRRRSFTRFGILTSILPTRANSNWRKPGQVKSATQPTNFRRVAALLDVHVAELHPVLAILWTGRHLQPRLAGEEAHEQAIE